jgi:hypothetical protein
MTAITGYNRGMATLEAILAAVREGDPVALAAWSDSLEEQGDARSAGIVREFARLPETIREQVQDWRGTSPTELSASDAGNVYVFDTTHSMMEWDPASTVGKLVHEGGKRATICGWGGVILPKLCKFTPEARRQGQCQGRQPR